MWQLFLCSHALSQFLCSRVPLFAMTHYFQIQPIRAQLIWIFFVLEMFFVPITPVRWVVASSRPSEHTLFMCDWTCSSRLSGHTLHAWVNTHSSRLSEHKLHAWVNMHFMLEWTQTSRLSEHKLHAWVNTNFTPEWTHSSRLSEHKTVFPILQYHIG